MNRNPYPLLLLLLVVVGGVVIAGVYLLGAGSQGPIPANVRRANE